MTFNSNYIQSISNVNFLTSLLQNCNDNTDINLIDSISDRQMQILDFLMKEKQTIIFSSIQNKETLQFLKELAKDLKKNDKL